MAELPLSGYERTIWNYLRLRIDNDYAVAGLMGNLYAESNLHPDIIEGDVPYSTRSAAYTREVDNGNISEYEFVNSGTGYGLAQWTWAPRKQELYNWYLTGMYGSIGSIDLALDFLWYELMQSYRGVLDGIMAATSVREASDIVLHDFENPANQSVAVEIKRAEYGEFYYNMFAGQPSIPTRRRMPIWMMCRPHRR